MTATLPDMAAKKKEPAPLSPEQQVAAELVRQAREKGLALTGPGGLLKQLTKTVIEAALQEEMTEHLGYEKHDPVGAGTGNIRNGSRGKTVLTEASGEVEIDVPRRPGRHVRAGPCQEAAATVAGCRPGGAVPVCQGAHDWGDLRALR